MERGQKGGDEFKDEHWGYQTVHATERLRQTGTVHKFHVFMNYEET